ncbi:hypothetical protein D1007_43962 [Hordeum vulgare]|nr:hypothetical protein D1007_43962 [Hordeum vulgare]
MPAAVLREAALGSRRGWGRAPPLPRDEPRGAAQAAWQTGAGHGQARRGGRVLQRGGQILALPTTASAGKCERRHGQTRARAGGGERCRDYVQAGSGKRCRRQARAGSRWRGQGRPRLISDGHDQGQRGARRVGAVAGREP